MISLICRVCSCCIGFNRKSPNHSNHCSTSPNDALSNVDGIRVNESGGDPRRESKPARGSFSRQLNIPEDDETTERFSPSNTIPRSPVLPTVRVSPPPSLESNSENPINSGYYTSPKGEKEKNILSSNWRISGSWWKSQSMMNITCSSDYKSYLSWKSTDDVAPPLLKRNTRLSKSVEAIDKVWESMDKFVNDDPYIDLSNGVVHFIASYNSSTKKLAIKIEKIEGLAPKGVGHSEYDCVVKLTILPPEKFLKFSSKVIHARSISDFKECIIFSVKCPSKKILRISVYDSNFIGKHDAVGHALFYIDDTLTHQQTSHCLKLYRQSMPDIQAGSVKMVLDYNADAELLNVFVDEAYNLPPKSGKSYVKLTQYYSGRKIKETESPCVNASQQIRYLFTANLKIDSSALQNSSIVITVKMRTFLKDTSVGRVILGPFLYGEYGESLTPWGRALINGEKVTHVFRMYL